MKIKDSLCTSAAAARFSRLFPRHFSTGDIAALGVPMVCKDSAGNGIPGASRWISAVGMEPFLMAGILFCSSSSG